MILHDALPHAEVKFVNYGRPEREQMPATPGQLWCDMSPPEARVQEFVEAGAIVLDHHESAEAVVRAFGDRGVYADEPGVSGAVLAFREVWARFCKHAGTGEAVRDFTTLAGIRDTWQKSHPRWREALVAYHALMFHPWEYWRTHPPHLNADVLSVGATLLTKREQDVESVAKCARIWTTTTGLKVAAVNCEAPFVSDTSEYLREHGEVDVFLGFQVLWQGNRKMIQVSSRSNGKFDCAKFSKMFGGGGHTQAAGFREGGPVSFLELEAKVEKFLLTLRPATC